MRAIVTVIGVDQVGIIAKVCGLLASMNINILDINQTVMQELFTMTMLVDTSACTTTYEDVNAALTAKGQEMGMSIRMQREDIFKAMHQI
ncbi:MAG: ACT domain-containing protein [Oscillospiraceae bacterium]|nr:ACT domain-containing protein [Oscillospiraceae bacterium]